MAAANQAALRRIARKRLRQDMTTTAGGTARRRTAGWDAADPLRLLTP
jgi:hypothetical protein